MEGDERPARDGVLARLRSCPAATSLLPHACTAARDPGAHPGAAARCRPPLRPPPAGCGCHDADCVRDPDPLRPEWESRATSRWGSEEVVVRAGMLPTVGSPPPSTNRTPDRDGMVAHDV
mmetsp:Transcript_12703/g.28438  ORF Transcript_12703/g.28438 Transcript_12703/m.28438 type:complete len:120 (-) Transcript_12703:9-368(-)